MTLQMCDSWQSLGPEMLGLGGLEKGEHKPGEKYGTVDSLSQADWDLLVNIWNAAGLKPFKFGILGDDWVAYQEAFDAAPNKPAWNLSGHSFYVGRKSFALKELLGSLSKDEQLIAFSAPGRICKTLESDSLLRVNDARRWLSHWGFELLEQSTSPIAAPDHGRVSGDSSELPPSPADEATNSWTLKRVQKFPGYRKPLYDLLRAAQISGKERPTARDVLDEWNARRPYSVIRTTHDTFDYADAKGSEKSVDLKALQQAIKNLTK